VVPDVVRIVVGVWEGVVPQTLSTPAKHISVIPLFYKILSNWSA